MHVRKVGGWAAKGCSCPARVPDARACTARELAIRSTRRTAQREPQQHAQHHTRSIRRTWLAVKPAPSPSQGRRQNLRLAQANTRRHTDQTHLVGSEARAQLLGQQLEAVELAAHLLVVRSQPLHLRVWGLVWETGAHAERRPRSDKCAHRRMVRARAAGHAAESPHRPGCWQNHARTAPHLSLRELAARQAHGFELPPNLPLLPLACG